MKIEVDRFSTDDRVVSTGSSALHAQQKTERARIVAACGLLAVVSILAYAPVWNAYFLADDFAYVRLYANHPFIDWWQIAAGDWTKGIWGQQLDELRSMMALAFWWDGRLWPFNLFGLHFTNLVFHAASSVMVFLLARSVFAGALGVSLAAGLLFSLHPIHAEAVSWISGRADPMCAFFSLASLWFFVHYRSGRRIRSYVLSLAAFVLALFSKEIAITFPLLPLGFDLFERKRSGKRWSALLPGLSGYFVLLAIYLGIRRIAFPHALREDALNFSVLKEFALRQQVYATYLFPHLPLLLLVLLISGVTIAALRRWSHKPLEGALDDRGALIFFGPWWYLACVAPLIVTYSSPRHLYLTSAGLCILTPLLIRVLVGRRFFTVAALCLCAVSAMLLFYRNFQWRFTADASDRARIAIERLVGVTPSGSGLIVNIPESIRNQYLWLGSLPFVMEPQYSLAGTYQHFRVVEKPKTYRYWSASKDGTGKSWIGDRRQVLEDLISHPTDTYVVSLDPARRILTRRIAAADVGAQLSPLLEIVGRHGPADAIDEINAEWESFWKRSNSYVTQ
ncbi:MAG TPA: glycosyltransferase family 39 protein [Candidatus Acidoferrum sp.]|nr:glycosyltransferase family 39 protein [Candidatus Acidoferrum sp.]